MNFRKFIFSDDLFAYFECFIDLDEIEDMNQIIESAIEKLTKKLKEWKMDVLIEKLNEKKEKKLFHIHDTTFENILLSEPNTIYYICSHH